MDPKGESRQLGSWSSQHDDMSPHDDGGDASEKVRPRHRDEK